MRRRCSWLKLTHMRARRRCCYCPSHGRVSDSGVPIRRRGRDRRMHVPARWRIRLETWRRKCMTSESKCHETTAQSTSEAEEKLTIVREAPQVTLWAVFDVFVRGVWHNKLV